MIASLLHKEIYNLECTSDKHVCKNINMNRDPPPDGLLKQVPSECTFLPIPQASCMVFIGFFMSGYNPERSPRCSERFNGAQRLGQAYILFLIAKITVHHIEHFAVVRISRKYSNMRKWLQRDQNINNDEKRVRTALSMNVTSCSNILSMITQSSNLCVFALPHLYREDKT